MNNEHRALCEIGRSQAVYDLNDALARLETAAVAVGLTERDKMDLVPALEKVKRLAGNYAKEAA